MSADPHDMGRRISAQRKGLRHADRAFCPSDGRLVAAVYAADGARWVWAAGGRTGSHGDLVRSIGNTAADIANAWQQRPAQPDDGVRARLLAVLRESLNEAVKTRARAEVPPAAWPLAEITPSWFADTPCPKCGRQMRIRVDLTGVLSIEATRAVP